MFDDRKSKGREIPGQSVADQQKVQLEQARTRVFDYQRKLAPEEFYVHIPFVKSIASFNPQPVTPILIDQVLKQEKSSMTGVINRITSDQFKAAEKVKSTIALTTVRKGVIGRVAFHSPGFGTPQKSNELPQTKKLNFLDQFFNFVNSIGRRAKK